MKFVATTPGCEARRRTATSASGELFQSGQMWPSGCEARRNVLSGVVDSDRVSGEDSRGEELGGGGRASWAFMEA